MVRLVQTYSVFKQIAKSICNEYSICFSSQNLPYSSASDFVKVCYAHSLRVRVPTTRNNKKAIRYKYLMTFLVRRKGLEPPTYWFVASHSIQLSYRRIPQAVFACEQYYSTFLLKMQVFFYIKVTFYHKDSL